MLLAVVLVIIIMDRCRPRCRCSSSCSPEERATPKARTPASSAHMRALDTKGMTVSAKSYDFVKPSLTTITLFGFGFRSSCPRPAK